MHLNTKKKKLTIWLAKVPKYLGEKILNLKSGASIGSLVLNKDTNTGASALSVQLSSEILSSGIPKGHLVDVKEKETNMYLVQNDSRKMCIEGVVNKEVFIRPVINSDYLAYKRKCKLDEGIEEEKVKVIDYYEELKRSAKYSSLREMELSARKRKQMLQNKKRERLDKEDVMEIIFNAFETHELWTVRDLADFSGQPVAYIQEIVNEICILNKKDHKNTYELKEEYRQK